MWVITVIDVATRAILGYSVTAEENYNQYDVLRNTSQKDIFQASIGISGGRRISVRMLSRFWATFDMIMLDNAKSHLAQNTINKLTDQLMCTMDFGSVATPESRGVVERFFKTMEEQCFHRLPGTTGSNVCDVRRHDPEKESVKCKITYNVLFGTDNKIDIVFLAPMLLASDLLLRAFGSIILADQLAFALDLLELFPAVFIHNVHIEDGLANLVFQTDSNLLRLFTEILYVGVYL